MAFSIDRLLSAPRPWQAFALTFVAYLLVARASLLLAIAPSGVAPLYPAAGIAVVAALAWGRPALLAVALGSLGAGLWSAAAGINGIRRRRHRRRHRHRCGVAGRPGRTG